MSEKKNKPVFILENIIATIAVFNLVVCWNCRDHWEISCKDEVGLVLLLWSVLATLQERNSPLLYRALLSEGITWAKLRERLGNCINEFFKAKRPIFSSWGLNTVTNSFTNIRQLDPRWPVIVSAQKYLFVAKEILLILRTINPTYELEKSVGGGVDNVFFFSFWERQSYNLEKKNEGC